MTLDRLIETDKSGENMNIKNTIGKYIFVIIPLMLLVSNRMILKIWGGGYANLSVNRNAFYLIMIILLLSPVVSLILETIGLVNAVRNYRQIDVDEPYHVKRRRIGYTSLFGGALLLTVVWFCAMLYITYQYLFG